MSCKMKNEKIIAMGKEQRQQEGARRGPEKIGKARKQTRILGGKKHTHVFAIHTGRIIFP